MIAVKEAGKDFTYLAICVAAVAALGKTLYMHVPTSEPT